MNHSLDHAEGRPFAGWTAVFAAIMMFTTLVMNFLAAGTDANLFYDPAKTLALAPDKIAAFQGYLLADVFGYYLPLVIIGAYLWRRLREQGGIALDMALLCVVIHVMLGVTGAAIQFAVLPALVEVHATGEAAARAAAEVAWLTTVSGAGRGIWWMEGPVIAFWGISTGLAMRSQGMKFGALLIVVAVLYALVFVLGAFAMIDLAGMFVVLAVLLQLVWTGLTGMSLLREKAG